jgi:FkbM family methyltransferase
MLGFLSEGRFRHRKSRRERDVFFAHFQKILKTTDVGSIRMRSSKILRDLARGIDFVDQPMGRYAPTAAQRAIIATTRACNVSNGALRNYGAIAVTKLRAAPVDVDYHGLTLRMYPTFCASARHMLFTPQASERGERDFILKYLPDDGVFVDAGANAGFFLFAVAAKRPSGVTLAFEPIAAFAEMLAFNIKANRLTQVTLETLALSDHDGEVAFNLDTQSTAYGENTIVVPARRLDSALAARGLDRVDVLKIDVEGSEDRVLLPFFRSAERSLWPRAVLIEDCFQNHWKEDCVAFMKGVGYREAFRGKLNVGLVRPEG